jgi:DNA-binding transcriptional LysR family regulator
VELRDLRALLAVVNLGSFTAAAIELGYTQSAISQQVAALEQELGQQLVRRRPVRPTPAGERLAEHAARVLLRLDVARSELRHLSEEAAEVRVVACPLASPELLVGALRELRSSNPLLRITVRTADAARAVAEVASGLVDAALVDGVSGPSEPIHIVDPGLLLSTPIAEAPLVVALPRGHPLDGRGGVDLDALVDAPWIVAPAFAGTDVQSRFGATPRRSPRLVYEGSDLPTLLALVAAGLGAALLPALGWGGFDGVVAVPVIRPQLVHRTELLTLRTEQARRLPLVQAMRSRATLR